MEILIIDRFQLLPHSYNFLTKVRNLESLIFESVSVGSVLEQSPTDSGSYSGPEGWLLQKLGSHTILGLGEAPVLFSSLWNTYSGPEGWLPQKP